MNGTGHKRTGSGRRQSHALPLRPDAQHLIDAGAHTPEQLIESVDQGLYCKAMGGGSVGPTGQFNFSVEEGYLIENGKLAKPVKGATLIGDAKEVMPRISMCANDLELAADRRFGQWKCSSPWANPTSRWIRSRWGPRMNSNYSLNATDSGSLQTLASREGIRRWDLGAACSDDAPFRWIAVKPSNSRLRSGARSRSGFNNDGLVGITSTTDLSIRLECPVGPTRPAVLQLEEIPQFSPLATAPLPELDRPFNPDGESFPCWTPFEMPKPIFSAAIPRFKPFRTTDWLNPCPKPHLNSDEHCVRWSAPKPASSLRTSGRNRPQAPQWRGRSSGSWQQRPDVRPHRRQLNAPSAIWTIDRLKRGATGFASRRRPSSPCSVPSAACSMRVRCSMG